MVRSRKHQRSLCKNKQISRNYKGNGRAREFKSKEFHELETDLKTSPRMQHREAEMENVSEQRTAPRRGQAGPTHICPEFLRGRTDRMRERKISTMAENVLQLEGGSTRDPMGKIKVQAHLETSERNHRKVRLGGGRGLSTMTVRLTAKLSVDPMESKPIVSPKG